MADAGEWMGLFASYRILSAPGEEVIHGVLRSGVDLGDPAVRRVVEGWPGPWYAERFPDRTELALVRPLAPEQRPRLLVHGGLFGVTLFTTLAAGALLQGVDSLRSVPFELGPLWLPVPTGLDWGALLGGAPFALTLLLLLLGHELGHYAVARRYRLRVSLPYFLPMPPYFSVVGTLGAFIRLRSPVLHRRMLFDVGVAGPAASLLLSIPAVVVGLRASAVVPGPGDAVTPFVVYFAGEALWLGGSALLAVLASLVLGPAGGPGVILLHPVAFAGWLGLFVTALNLLPFGQLDGGHVLYALLGPRQRRAARALVLLLLPLGWLWWGWWIWLVVVLAIGRGRLGHPRLLQEEVALGRGRRLAAWGAVLVFLLTFVPVPVRI